MRFGKSIPKHSPSLCMQGMGNLLWPLLEWEEKEIWTIFSEPKIGVHSEKNMSEFSEFIGVTEEIQYWAYSG